MTEKQKREQWVEEIEVTTNDLVAKVKELIAQGNVRKLIVRRKTGEVLLEVPLTATVAVGGAMLVFTPIFAALGALAAVIAEVRLEVVRAAETDEEEEAEEASGKRKIEIE